MKSKIAFTCVSSLVWSISFAVAQSGDFSGYDASTTSSPYIIQKDDNLWNISKVRNGDPFTWRKVWQDNPYIRNPDLIYPGDTLYFGPVNHIASTDPSSSQSQIQTIGNGLSDASNASAGIVVAEGRIIKVPGDSLALLAGFSSQEMVFLFGSKELFSSELLAKIGFIWTQKDAHGLIFPGNGVIEKTDGKDVFRQFDQISILQLGDVQYNPGDIIDIFNSDGLTYFKNKTVNIVRRIGRAKITEVHGSRVLATVEQLWDIIHSKNRIARSTDFVRKDIDSIAMAEPLEATIFRRVEKSEAAYLNQSLILDKGSMDGVADGDLFLFYNKNGKIVADKPAAMGCVVHVTEESSTALIVKMYSNSVKNDDVGRRFKRIVFK